MKDGAKRNLDKMRLLLLTPVFIIMFASYSYPASAEDSYINGYAASILEREFDMSPASLSVKDGVVYISSEEIGGVDRDKFISALLKIKGVERVEILEPGQAAPAWKQPERAGHNKERIFDPLIADPRWPHFSMSYQTYTDNGEFGNVFAASFGETLPLYTDDGPFGGRWQVGVQAAGFIIHDLDTASWDLINEDYRGGVTLFYRKDVWSGLFSIYHNSSHVGDEFLLHNHVDRVNFSYEAAQMKLSYDLGRAYRIYGGADFMFSPDPKDLKRWFTQYGFEFRCPKTYLKGSLRPIAGIDVKNRQENDWHSEVAVTAGVKLESEKTLWNKLNFMLEYYNGNSPNGQFHENFIEYWAVGAHFYF